MVALSRLFVVALTVAYSAIATAQGVNYDWAARSLQSYPTNITQTSAAVVQIHNVNDILYSYTVKSECTQNQTDPFGSIAGLIGGTQPTLKGGLTPSPCETAIGTAQTAVSSVGSKINEMMNAPTSNAGCSAASPCDISLAQSQSFWDQNVKDLAGDADSKVKDAQNKCSSDPSNASALASLVNQYAQIARTRDKVKATKHDYSVTVTLLPDSSCQLTITQRFGSTQTQNGSEVATFSPGQPRLTLSAGPLFSEIQDRSYSVVTVPSSGAASTSPTQSVLQINGNSRITTYLTGLLNIHVPSSNQWVNGERFGAALSTGPVLRVGGQSSASAFGWFGGASYYVTHLIFITAGLHVGQFAGNPAGFAASNQVVPSNSPTPTAQNRTTVRFAVALTLKAKDFSKLSNGTSGAGAGSPPAPKHASSGNQSQGGNPEGEKPK